MLIITPHISIHEAEIKFTYIASPGPGGQHVNKVATAAQLRFNVRHSASLPEEVRERLRSLLGRRITAQGDIIIRAHRYRTRERNKQDALDRLVAWLKRAAEKPKKRKKTKPTRASLENRLHQKKLQGTRKSLRRRHQLED